MTALNPRNQFAIRHLGLTDLDSTWREVLLLEDPYAIRVPTSGIATLKEARAIASLGSEPQMIITEP